MSRPDQVKIKFHIIGRRVTAAIINNVASRVIGNTSKLIDVGGSKAQTFGSTTVIPGTPARLVKLPQGSMV